MSHVKVVQVWERLTTQDQHKRAGLTVRRPAALFGLITVIRVCKYSIDAQFGLGW